MSVVDNLVIVVGVGGVLERALAEMRWYEEIIGVVRVMVVGGAHDEIEVAGWSKVVGDEFGYIADCCCGVVGAESAATLLSEIVDKNNYTGAQIAIASVIGGVAAADGVGVGGGGDDYVVVFVVVVVSGGDEDDGGDSVVVH